MYMPSRLSGFWPFFTVKELLNPVEANGPDMFQTGRKTGN